MTATTENHDHMTVVADAVRQVAAAGGATLYQQAMLAAQVAIANEIHLLRLTIVASTQAHGDYVGAWMQQIDSQLDSLAGKEK